MNLLQVELPFWESLQLSGCKILGLNLKPQTWVFLGLNPKSLNLGLNKVGFGCYRPCVRVAGAEDRGKIPPGELTNL